MAQRVKATPDEPIVGKQKAGTFAVVGIFAAVCPPATALAYLVLMALSEVVVQRFPSVQYREVVWFVLLYGIIFGYFVLVWPAAFAGYLIARLHAVNRRVRWWGALVIGLVSGAAVQLILVGWQNQDSANYFPGQELIPMTAFATAIMVGWAIVRNWYIAPPNARVSP